MRAAGMVAAAVLLTLAGCSGAAGPAAETRTVTPAPVPAASPSPAAAGTPAPTATPYPPGLSAEGVTDPAALLAAHADSLAGTSYVHQWRVVARGPGGDRRWAVSAIRTVGPEAALTATSREGRVAPPPSAWPFGDAARVTVYAAGGTAARATTANGTTRYARGPAGRYAADRRADRLLSRDLPLLLSAFDTRLAGRTARRGTTLRQVVLAGRTPPRSMDHVDRTERLRNASLALLVDRRGLVHGYRYAYTRVVDGRQVRIERRGWYDRIWTETVEPPDWVARVPRSRNASGTPTGASTPGADAGSAGDGPDG